MLNSRPRTTDVLAECEWTQHVEIAMRSGLTEAEITCIQQGPEAGWNVHEAALLQAADDLFENSVVSDQTWATLAAKYSTEQMMDVVFTLASRTPPAPACESA